MDEFVLKDRKEAGILLSQKLKGLNLNDAIVLAIPRGGVVIGYEVATAMGADLDIVTPRKMKDQFDPELAIGAVMPDGSTFLNQQVIAARSVSDSYINEEKGLEMRESSRRLRDYRGGRPYPRLSGRTVVLVDDGIATGATMIAAARWVRKQNPGTVIIAVPVIPPDMLDSISGQADQIVYLSAPELFFGIGQFYKDFPQVDDREVIEILKGYWTGRRARHS